MSKSNRTRLLTAALSLTLLPGVLMAAPGDNDRKKERKRDRDLRVERRVERQTERRREQVREVRRRQPRVVECAEPIRHRHDGRRSLHCGCVEVIRPGYYKTVIEKVRTKGYYERVWVPGRRLRFDGCTIEVGTRRGHYERRYVPGKIRKIERQVWVPAERVIEKRCHKHGKHARGRHRH